MSDLVANLDSIPLNDLSLQWRQIEAEALPDLGRLFMAGAFCLGPWVERFEQAVAQYLGVRHAVGVNSGTSALHLAMIAAGVGPGDEVLIPANTFVATAWAVLYAGARPVFCDVTADSWTIDATDAERRITTATKAVVPVHLYGQPANMDAVAALARKYNLLVIEDTAQAIGASYGDRKLGGHGILGCFSFYPSKNLGAAGEGGLVTTDDSTLATRVRRLRHHAQGARYVHDELGFNYRMEGIQGLILGHKLPHLDDWTAERRAIARRYIEGLVDAPVQLPMPVTGDHVWHTFVIHTAARDRLHQALAAQGIQTGMHYPIPLNRQPCFAKLPVDPEGYPVAERNARECLSLPLFVGMTDGQVDRVIDAVRNFFRAA